MVDGVKAALFAIFALVSLDVTVNHGAGTRRFFAGIADFGAGIGAWVFYTG